MAEQLGRRRSDRVALVGVVVGNAVAHEAGHLFGAWHTTNDLFFDPWERLDAEQVPIPPVPTLADEGGSLPNLVGTGPDQVFGTGDDVDVDFVADHFSLLEGFSGIEDTARRVRSGQQTAGAQGNRTAAADMDRA